ncbi:hypothetical protein NDU88_004271 [Pleurodeles waltl]|uniref:Uncharacterized protein n=1 Tax=Pleurodeles waltl TaxID=8319 RepID=A0AAV7QFF3_PLEWA|nr:hypothetical protein NDU88_004271 [Pleurodeles waltl]
MRLPGVGSTSTLTCMCTCCCPLGSRCIVRPCICDDVRSPGSPRTRPRLWGAVPSFVIPLSRTAVVPTPITIFCSLLCATPGPRCLLLPCPPLWAARLPSISVLQDRAGREPRVPQLSLRSLGARVRSGQSTSAGALLPSSTLFSTTRVGPIEECPGGTSESNASFVTHANLEEEGCCGTQVEEKRTRKTLAQEDGENWRPGTQGEKRKRLAAEVQREAARSQRRRKGLGKRTS